MELMKKRIRTNQFKGRAYSQITLDDDFNVPDIRPDIDKIIEETGDLKITETRINDGKVTVRGKLEFAVLYISSYAERPLHHMKNAIDFEEIVNMDGVDDNDDVKVTWDMEDLRTSLINSRKLSVRSIITLSLTASCICEIEAASEVAQDRDVCSKTGRFEVSQIHIHKKDTFRIKDEIAVPANKPNMMEILWHDAMIDSLEIKLLDDKISLRGEIGVFILYASQEEKNPMQFFNTTVAFSGNMECHGAREEMIGNINAKIIQGEMEIKEDNDKEPRNVGVEVVLELEMSVFELEEAEILEDVYALNRRLIPQRQPVILDNLLMKNQSNCKLHQKLKIKNDQSKILQICQTNGNIKIDRTEINDAGILVEGVVYVQILYVAADDRAPVNAIKGTIPFSHQIEISDIDQDCSYEISPVLEQVNSTMLDSEEIEVKALLVLGTVVFKRTKVNVIQSIDEEMPDMKAMEAMPNIIGYIVKPGDQMWDLAKQFNTTREIIMETNELTDELLMPRQKIIIMTHLLKG